LDVCAVLAVTFVVYKNQSWAQITGEADSLKVIRAAAERPQRSMSRSNLQISSHTTPCNSLKISQFAKIQSVEKSKRFSANCMPERRSSHKQNNTPILDCASPE
jgi:hypothetical protein